MKKTTQEIKVRFAPSPTGHLHLGTARTALFNWLFARHHQAKFILRIEDTDRSRSTLTFEEAIIEDLAWLGLYWDEGPDIGGPAQLYRQTERLQAGVYKRFVERLLQSNHAYYCYCTPQELEAQRQQALAQGKMPKYSGRCRYLTKKQRQELISSGRQPAVRFAISETGPEVKFQDLLKGEVVFSREVLTDFIIWRANQSPTYNLAVVVDDIDMQITHVLRGEDHLTNTAYQLLLYEALEKTPPKFGHFSMILGPDKTKLSKRHGATAIGEYKAKGYLPEALVNYLALLSWSPPAGQEVLPVAEIVKLFSLERVGKSPAIFDIAKLNWLNGQHIRRKDTETLTNLLIPYYEAAGFIKGMPTPTEFSRLLKVTEAIKTDLTTLVDVKEQAAIFFAKPKYSDEVKLFLSQPQAQTILNSLVAKVRLLKGQELDFALAKQILTTLTTELKSQGFKSKDIYQTVRLALTGQRSGPELFYLLSIIGVEPIIWWQKIKEQ